MQIAGYYHRQESESILGEGSRMLHTLYWMVFKAAVAVPSFCFISEKDLIGGFYTEV